MKHATFYFLKKNAFQGGLSVIERLICEITAKHWRNGKQILIACESKQQAVRLNKVLWVYPEKSFIPHVLLDHNKLILDAPIEISWGEKQNNNTAKDILINLLTKFTEFITTFTEVVDFIPYEEALKRLARDRYRAYRLAGFNINIATWK